MTDAPVLAGRTALVVGGTGVIGARVCARLAALGATLLVHCRSSIADAERIIAADPAAGGTASGGSAGHRIVQADLEDAEGLADLAEAVETAGGVDILINAVHLGSGTSEVVAFDSAQLRTHLESVVLHAALSGMVVPGMRVRGAGRIVYISGALMTRPAPGMGGYGAAKAAASTLTRYLALEEGRAGITANIVAPGRVVDPDAPRELDPEWARLADALVARTALGRFPTPDDVAHAVVGLTLPSASGITGQTVWVTGGEPIG